MRCKSGNPGFTHMPSCKYEQAGRNHLVNAFCVDRICRYSEKPRFFLLNRKGVNRKAIKRLPCVPKAVVFQKLLPDCHAGNVLTGRYDCNHAAEEKSVC